MKIKKLLFLNLVLICGIIFQGNAQQTYNGILQHSNGYFLMYPYSSSYDDGSYVKMFYDGNTKRIQFWNSDLGTDYTNIYVGSVHAHEDLISRNPDNVSASVALGWKDDVARIRVGGNGSGASNGIDIQGPGDTSLLRVDGNGNLSSRGRVLSKTDLTTYNPNNPGATVALSWSNDAARIRVGGAGTGATAGFDIQTTGNRSLMKLLHNGNVGIGTLVPDSKLAVNGNIHAKEVKVDLVGWPDYVFKEGYDLPTLEEIQRYIQEKGHLPNIPSAKEVEENGVQLGEMNKLLLEKIEELTLYTLQQQKALQEQKNINKSLEERLAKLEKAINN